MLDLERVNAEIEKSGKKDRLKSLASLETEDLLLILILYLMYRESGDKELLIIMGAMYLL